jgi:hypothetical protein
MRKSKGSLPPGLSARTGMSGFEGSSRASIVLLRTDEKMQAMSPRPAVLGLRGFALQRAPTPLLGNGRPMAMGRGAGRSVYSPLSGGS